MSVNDSHRYLDRRKLSGIFVAVVFVVGVVSIFVIIDNIPTSYQYEAWLPSSEARDTRFTIAGVDEANITVSFTDEPGLWYRMEITHYSSIKRHAVETIDDPDFLPLRVHVTSVTPVKNINLVFGIEVAHSLYISGKNLNTMVTFDNGARLYGSRCIFYGTGAFHFFLTENVNFTSGGMVVKVGDLFSNPIPPELVILDIDLPTGLNGHLTSPNVSFIQNEWSIHYNGEYGTLSIDEPLLDIMVYHARKVWASLQI